MFRVCEDVAAVCMCRAPRQTRKDPGAGSRGQTSDPEVKAAHRQDAGLDLGTVKARMGASTQFNRKRISSNDSTWDVF